MTPTKSVLFFAPTLRNYEELRASVQRHPSVRVEAGDANDLWHGPDLTLRVEPVTRITIGHKVLAAGFAVRATHGTQEAGVCGIARPGDDLTRANASDWCFCYELRVEESLRGRGLGKSLLATGLAEMKQAGCKHAAISTDWDNYRAALFYANLGYRLIDRTFSFRRELSGTSPTALE